MRTGELLCQAVDVVEVTIRLVLVLLVQLVLVESLIVELQGLRGGWGSDGSNGCLCDGLNRRRERDYAKSVV